MNTPNNPPPLTFNNLFWAERVSMKMLRYFYVASHSHNLTQTAERLHISKSPLSAQMRELETILGVTLFNREQRSIQLTATGMLLRDECQLLFDQMDNSINKVIQHTREAKGHLRIGMVSSAFWAGFGDASQQLKREFSHVQFEFIEQSPLQQKVALFNNEIDLGIVRYADTLDIEPLASCNLYCEPMVVALPHGHSLSTKKQLCLSELAAEKFVMMNQKNSSSAQLIVNHCISSGFTPQIIQEVVEPMTLMNVIESHAGISIVPQSFSRQLWQRIQFVPLKQPIQAHICAIYHPQQMGVEKQAVIQSINRYMSQ
ncbi:MAG: LysR family transcriptional regulator [Shewanella sp.]